MSTFQSVPMWRLTERMVRSTLVTAWRLATSPTRTSPPFANATTDGVVREPSALAMTVGSPPSRTLTTELVVPRSMPTARAMGIPPGSCSVFRFGVESTPRNFAAWHNSSSRFAVPSPRPEPPITSARTGLANPRSSGPRRAHPRAAAPPVMSHNGEHEERDRPDRPEERRVRGDPRRHEQRRDAYDHHDVPGQRPARHRPSLVGVGEQMPTAPWQVGGHRLQLVAVLGGVDSGLALTGLVQGEQPPGGRFPQDGRDALTLLVGCPQLHRFDGHRASP